MEQDLWLPAGFTERKRFEVRLYKNNGALKKAIFIDGIMLDYHIDLTEFYLASKKGLNFKRSVQSEIVKHFTKTISEIVGRRVTPEEIIQCIEQVGFNYEIH